MEPMEGVTAVLGLGTALPPYSDTQVRVARFMARVLEASVPAERRDRALALVKRIYAASGIERRYSVVPDFGADDPAGFQLFPANWQLEPFPSTATRMRVYEETSVELAVEAARRALSEARVRPEEVSHLVICTCTGFFAPGPETLLIQRLELKPTVMRTTIGFMGCYAGFNGLRTADQIIRAQPRGVVLQVSIELCTLHFQKKDDPDTLVANCLFGDGSAAVVYGFKEDRGPGLATVLATQCAVNPDSLDQMSWRIGDTGFEMRLAATVPETLEAAAPAFVAALLDSAGVERAGVSGWALHPGGRRIVEAMGDALELAEPELEPALAILRDHGNMSSATIFFVLDNLFRTTPGDGDGHLVALGFGPGLTLEGAVLKRSDDQGSRA